MMSHDDCTVARVRLACFVVDPAGHRCNANHLVVDRGRATQLGDSGLFNELGFDQELTTVDLGVDFMVPGDEADRLDLGA